MKRLIENVTKSQNNDTQAEEGEEAGSEEEEETTSDYETNEEEYVLDMMHTLRRKVGGKRVPVNIPYAPMDNVSFHFETSVQKWKYVFQRRIACERELSKEAFDCKEIMELLKIVTDVGHCYEKLINKFIMNITIGCNVACNKEYRKVYDRGKCVNFPPSNVNDYLGGSKFAGSNKVPSIDKIKR